jgi:phosphatidate cytidylyltransferase
MATRPPARRRPPPARRRQSRRGEGRHGFDLFPRVLVAVPAIAFAILIVDAGGMVFALGILALGFICLHELYQMLERTRPVKLAGFIGVTALVFAALWGGPLQVLLVQVALIPVTFGLAMLVPRRGSATIGMAVTLFSLWWIGLALAHAVLLRGEPHGAGIIVDILVGTFLGDTGAYFGGRMYGQRRLAPGLSPNKTVEGLGIGVVTAVFATWFAGLYQDWLPGGSALLLGVGVALAAPVGDLFESLVKREAATKDTGRLFGAHGGALDRLDAVLFTIVAGYYIWIAVQ